ncbi:MAG: ribonuclease R [Peptostreptococcaceae bacterium]|nr:ribonuclease R [Peptostreptococcaceae bacterium]
MNKKKEFVKSKKNKKIVFSNAIKEKKVTFINEPKETGTLMKHKKGFGFVVPDEETGNDIFISTDDMNNAMNGDKVSVRVTGSSTATGKREGIIENIITRNITEIVGTFDSSNNFGFVISDDKRQNDDVFIKKNDFKGAKKGDKVVVTISKYPEKGHKAEGFISEIISRYGEVGGDIKALIRSYNLIKTFPSSVNAEATAISKKETMTEAVKRLSLKDRKIITVDGADAKDLDDAISLSRLPNGNYLLGVHIADVSHYVAEGGRLDKEALKRGNSVYLIDQVIPMLPTVLSNGVCSLNEKVDRLTLSIDMEINGEGKVVNHVIYESVINSTARMVYSDVSDIIEDKSVDLISKYAYIYEEILLMDELALILRKKRVDRGSLDFDFDEAHITLNNEGIPISIEIAERRVANKIIEEFMLLANETVAEHFYHLEIPFVYRIHEKPALEKMEEFQAFIRGFGITLKGTPENIHPKALSDVLKKVENQSYENVVNTIMLRSMKKAFYGVDCEGHFGLGVKFYCHFTSPIRRYPDLMIHRIIKESLKGKLSESRIKSLKKKAIEASSIASATERKAQELEREVEKLKKAEYMSKHIGETFDGIISGVSNYGFYVELPNTIEGMVRVSFLMDDFYDHDSQNYRLIGRDKHKVYALGDKIVIKVKDVNIPDGEIDFMVVNPL